ncbi:RluA family pseudouridine synthase [Thermodesulfobacteriota bacterium]
MKFCHTFQCAIKPQQDGLTLTEALTQRFPYLQREEWRGLIAAGTVLVNGSPALPDLILNSGDRLLTRIDGHEEPSADTEIRTIYADEDFLLVEKPAGMPVSRTGRIIHHTLINILRRQQQNPEIQLMHRLDRETGGLLLCARNRKTCKQWQQHLPEILTRKFYLAMVRGRLEVNNYLIQLPLAEQNHSAIRCQMHVDPGGKTATTTLHTIAANAECSLILAELHSGRKHQLRAHLAHLGHPLFGDKIYSYDGHYFLTRLERELTDTDYAELGALHHTLHAWAVALQLPGHAPSFFFSSRFSKDMKQYLHHFPNWREKAEQGLMSLGVREELLVQQR